MSLIYKYQTGNKLYVSDPNDPRLKAYQDSLTNYNNNESYYTKGLELFKNSNDYVDFIVKLKKLDKEFPVDNTKATKVDSTLARKALAGNPRNSEFDFKKTVDVKKPTREVLLREAEKPKEKVTKTNFEERISKPDKSIKNQDDTTSTHKMMSFEADGKYYAAPTIVDIDGELVELSEDDAVDFALEKGEFKEFKSEAEAQKYAEGGYKKGTPLEEPTESKGILLKKPSNLKEVESKLIEQKEVVKPIQNLNTKPATKLVQPDSVITDYTQKWDEKLEKFITVPTKQLAPRKYQKGGTLVNINGKQCKKGDILKYKTL